MGGVNSQCCQPRIYYTQKLLENCKSNEFIDNKTKNLQICTSKDVKITLNSKILLLKA